MYPAEIENIMSGHAAVASVAVVGVPDAWLGEVGMAFVVPTTGTEPDTAALIVAWCRVHMANYKVPRDLEIVEELPLNAVQQGVEVRAGRTRSATSERRVMFNPVHSSAHDSVSIQDESVRSGVR